MNGYPGAPQVPEGLSLDSPGWVFFVKASFGIALLGMLGGIVMMPVDLWVRGYLLMGSCFLVGTSISLAKTMRDQFEGQRMINRLAQARAEKLLQSYTEDDRTP